VVAPNGMLNINATPWASVWIDGNPVGDTPLGNLSITPGEHEVVFRHPQFGERRERAIVRVDGVTRVAVNFR
jgi:PEGA domain